MVSMNGLSNVTNSNNNNNNNNNTTTTTNDIEKFKQDKEQFLQELWPRLLQEARAVSLWSCVALACRIALIFLVTVAAYRHDKSAIQFIPYLNHSSSPLYKELWMTISVICGWILSLAPAKVLTQQAPGFIFANPWVLLWVRDKTTILPNIPVRACEYMLGRISLMELVSVLPIHFVTIVSTSVFLRGIFPERLASLALEPIAYSNQENPWLVDVSREIFITACFTVGVLVLPVFFRLNHIPRWVTTCALYPVFNYAVDGAGMASSFTPNVVLALAMLGREGLPVGYRFLASIIGGLVGGKIMQRYFPDDRKSINNQVSIE